MIKAVLLFSVFLEGIVALFFLHMVNISYTEMPDYL